MASPEEIYAAEKYYLGNKDYSGLSTYLKSVSPADYQRYTAKRAVLIEADRSGGQKVGDAIGTLLLGTPAGAGGRLAAQSGTRAIGRTAPKEVLEYVAARKAGSTIKAPPAVAKWLTDNYGGVLSGMGGINRALAKTTTEKIGEQGGRLLGRAIPKSKLGKLAVGGATGGGIYSLLKSAGGNKQAVEPDGAGLASITDWVNGIVERSAEMGVEANKQALAQTALGQLTQKYRDLGFDEATAQEAAQEALLRQLSDGGGGDGSGVGYAQIAEQRRQFDIQNERESSEFTRSFAQKDNQFVMDQMRGMEEFQKNYAVELERLGLTKQQVADARSQFAQSFAENQRQFNQQEGRLTKQFDAQLGETTRANKAQEADAARQRALAEQQYIGQILSRPSDFLARAFSSRGGQSPYSTVSQADLINQLQAGVQGATRGFAKGGTTQEGKFVTGEQGAEIIINPTNAPIMVLNHEQSKGAMGKLPGYQEGTWTDPWDTGERFAQGPDSDKYDWLGALNAAQAQANLGPTYAQGVATANNPSVNTGPGTFYNTDPNFRIGTTDVAGVQRGSLPGGGEYYRNPSGTSGATGGQSSQFIYFQNVLGMSSDVAAKAAGFPDAATAIRSVDSGYMTQEEAGRLGQFEGGGTGFKGISQEELKRLALGAAPPASKAALYGGKIGNARPAGQLTLGRLGRLTGPELEALNTLLGVTENSDLQTELGLLQQRFGPVVSRSRGRFAV